MLSEVWLVGVKKQAAVAGRAGAPAGRAPRRAEALRGCRLRARGLPSCGCPRAARWPAVPYVPPYRSVLVPHAGLLKADGGELLGKVLDLAAQRAQLSGLVLVLQHNRSWEGAGSHFSRLGWEAEVRVGQAAQHRPLLGTVTGRAGAGEGSVVEPAISTT